MNGSDGYVRERKDWHRVPGRQVDPYSLSLVGIMSFDLYTVKPFISLLIPLAVRSFWSTS